MTDHVTTAPDGELYYRYSPPPNTDSKMILLHKHGCAIIGEWGKGLGLVAWCPLPRRNREIEDKLKETDHGR
jgi:hypothetical protein